jgi:hypothetical protein
VTHQFVKNQVNVIRLKADEPQNVIMLTDIRGSIYATCGVLPRKAITMPKDFLDASLRNTEPVFPVGPIFSVGAATNLMPLFPPPQVQGYFASFVSDPPGAPNQFPDIPLPPSSPIGDLPAGRVTLNEGWLKVHLRQPGS